MRRLDGWRVGGILLIGFLLLATLAPMAWMLVTSIKT